MDFRLLIDDTVKERTQFTSSELVINMSKVSFCSESVNGARDVGFV